MISCMLSRSKKRLRNYVIIVFVSAVFSIVYEFFSHQVYSNFMIYIFTIPLILGVVVQLVLLMRPNLDVNNPWQRTAQDFAIASLMAGSALQGIVEIYGTTNQYIVFYFVVGLLLLALSFVIWVICKLKK